MIVRHVHPCRLVPEVLDWQDVNPADLRSAGNTVVFTNGVFDLLHPGHIRYLQREIREGRRNVGALKLSNLLQPDRFE